MRIAKGNYAAIERSLRAHQRQTLAEYANGLGIPLAEMWASPVCCTVALALAVENKLPDFLRQGLNERQALARIAAEFDIDFGSLERQQRRKRRRNRPD